MSVFDKFFERYSYKFPKGYPDFTNKQDILILENILDEIGLFENTFYDVVGGSKLDNDIFDKLNSGDNFDVDAENITFKGGGGKTYTPKTIDKTDDYTLDDIRKIIDEFEKPLFLTYTNNIIKLRTPFGVRILSQQVPTKTGSSDFKRLIALNKLKSEYPDKIKVTAKLAAGLGYEQAQVENLNKVINEVIQLNNNEALDLYIDGQPQEVQITGALKRAGSGKADLALVNGEKEVYWISYKEGAYKTDEGKYSKVPFQQYGSLVTLYNQEYDGEMSKFGNYLKTIIPEFLNSIKDKGEGVAVFKDVNFNPLYNIKSAKDEFKFFENSKGDKIPVSDSIKSFWGELPWKNFQDLIGSSTADVVIVEAASSFYNAFVDDNDKQSQILAGKSVYGLDFPSKEYSSENCNMLLQSDGTVEIQIIGEDGEDNPKGINLEIQGSSGHVLFNPDLPVNSNDPGYPYTPALNMRHTKAMSFGYESSGKKTIYLAGRLLIMPIGNLKSATEISI